jgi:Na+/proline symporter
MSTGSAFTVDGGALFAQNLYRRYFARERSDQHYLLVGRFAGVGVTTMGVLFGLYVESVLEAFLFTETIAAFMGISLFGAVAWRRSNRWGAVASLIVSASLFFWLTWQDFNALLQWDAANFGWALLAGFVALAIVSKLTPPESEEHTAPFFERLQKPMYLDRKTGEEKPLEGEGHDLLVVHLFNLRLGQGLGPFYRRFRTDIQGLVIAFGVVVALIALARGLLFLP